MTVPMFDCACGCGTKFSISRPLYSSCAQTKRERMRTESREEAKSIFTLAGFTFKEYWQLANGYWPNSPDYDDIRRPWWLFATQLGLIRIGWRKSVLEIDWTSTGIECVVTDDDVTKSSAYVHAWSVDKAIVYLRALREGANHATIAVP